MADSGVELWNPDL